MRRLFEIGNDIIDVNANPRGTITTAYLHQVGTDIAIDLGGGNIITVTNAAMTDVSAHMAW